MATEVLVVSEPTSGQRAGDWAVKVGSRTVSRHRLKRQAVANGRTEARQRNGVLKVQNTSGQFRTEASYTRL